MTEWRLAPGVVRVDAVTLVGSSPFRVMRFTTKGAKALSDLLVAKRPPVPSSASGRLAARLVRAGMLVPPLPEPVTPVDVTVIIPALSAPEPVRRLLDRVPEGVPIIVVDDGSPEPLAPLAQVRPGVVVVRHDCTRGAAAARNSGVAMAKTRWVVFVDADLEPPEGWLDALVGVAAESDIIAVAPRVINSRTPGLAGLVESRASALDLGAVPVDVAAGTPVSFVPTAALLIDREHLLAVGGFDESMPVGEDVDLVWRLTRRGRVRYEPRIHVAHRPRSSLRKVLSRRRFYGSSVGLLEVRHPGAIRHVDVSLWAFLPWMVGVAVHPLAGVAVAGAAVAGAPRGLPGIAPREARRLAAHGQLLAVTSLGRWLVRPILPVTAVAMVFSRKPLRQRLLLAVAAGCADVAMRAAVDERRAGASVTAAGRAAAETLLARTLDDLASSVGVWQSCLHARTLRPLLPRVRRPPRVGRRG